MATETRFEPLAAPAKPRRRRWMRRFAIAFALLFIAVAGTYGIWRYRALAARDAEIAKIRAAGEPVWFAELKPAPLDPAQDGTPLLWQAAAAMTPLPDELIEEMRKLRERVETESFDVDDATFEAGTVEIDGIDGGATEDEGAEGPVLDEIPELRKRESLEARERRLVEALRPHVEANREAFELLVKALDQGGFQFEVDYDDPVPLLRDRPERHSCWQFAKLLEARFRCQIYEGETAAAGATCEQMLCLARRMMAINDSVGSLSLNLNRTTTALESIAETIERGGFDKTQRLRLDSGLVELGSTTRLRPALVAERAEQMTDMEKILEHGADGELLVESPLERWLVRPVIWSNQADYLESMAVRVEFADRYDDASAKALSDAERHEESNAANSFFKRLQFAHFLVPPPEVNVRVRNVRDRLLAARVGLCVDAFRRERGRLPTTLEEVKGEGLAEIPRDVARGEPLVYLMDEDAFSVCPADKVEREKKRLARRVKERDAPLIALREAADADDDGFVQDEDDPNGEADDDDRSGAFRVVYVRARRAEVAEPAAPAEAKPADAKDAEGSSIESKFLSNVRQVTSGFVKAGEGYFSPDGKTVIYQAQPKDYPFYQIYTQPLDGGEATRVSTGRGRTTCSFFSPDGKKILFASSHLDPDIDATEAAAIKQQEEDRRTGRRPRYQWDFDPHMDIFEADLDGKNLRRLTTERGYDAEGAYSRDGKSIAFCSDRDGDPDLYVMDADGGNVRQLTNEPGYDGGPFISPDGKWVVYRSDRKEKDRLQIHVIGIDGRGDVALTDDANYVHWAPYWHPSEPYLIWCGADHAVEGRPNYDLWLMKYKVKGDKFAADGEMIRVTENPAADVLPVFSPDGKKLMWTSGRTEDRSSQLFIADFALPAAAGR